MLAQWRVNCYCWWATIQNLLFYIYSNNSQE